MGTNEVSQTVMRCDKSGKDMIVVSYVMTSAFAGKSGSEIVCPSRNKYSDKCTTTNAHCVWERGC